MHIIHAYKTLRTLGPTLFGRRLFHAFKLKSGLMKWLDASGPCGPVELQSHLMDEVTPARMLAERREGKVPFFFRASQLNEMRGVLRAMAPEEADRAIHAKVEALERGRVEFFSHWEADLGDPIQWQLNPIKKSTWPTDRHWSDYGLFNPDLGDVKLVWEASRFSQCYFLTRAFAFTGDERPLSLALRRMEEWIDANPAARGVQWNCGQETAFRLMAWCFTLNAAYATELLSVERFAKITASIYRQALRIERHIGFSQSLKNNHALSEAVGLYTAGLLFPEFDRAEAWTRMGKRILVEHADKQIFEDGSFIQHSMNYHRVMLHDCIWAARLGRLHGDAFPERFVDRVRKASDFVFQMHDAQSGRVPNYGANDGALVLPLSSCDYLDYRPVIQSSHYLANGRLVLDDGPWNEELLWLFGAESLKGEISQAEPRSSEYDVGGYYTIRGKETWGMIRCHTYKERPGQADMLHFDLWWRGRNILRDSGTFQYYCPKPWIDYFKTTRAHNTIEVDGMNQMTKGPRFLWFDWTRSRFREHVLNDDDRTERWEGEHYGYVSRCGVTHRRVLDRNGDRVWVIRDELLGSGRHDAVLSWNLGDWPCVWDPDESRLSQETPVGMIRLTVSVEGCERHHAEVVRGLEDAESPQGWESLYYAEKKPIPVLRLAVSGTCPMRFVTHLELGGGHSA